MPKALKESASRPQPDSRPWPWWLPSAVTASSEACGTAAEAQNGVSRAAGTGDHHKPPHALTCGLVVMRCLPVVDAALLQLLCRLATVLPHGWVDGQRRCLARAFDARRGSCWRLRAVGLVRPGAKVGERVESVSLPQVPRDAVGGHSRARAVALRVPSRPHELVAVVLLFCLGVAVHSLCQQRIGIQMRIGCVHYSNAATQLWFFLVKDAQV
jgi:hypothetical protein